MNTYGQVFLNQSTAPATSLGCIARVNQHTLSTSFFRFVLSELSKLIPSCIRDAFCKTMVFKHILFVQFFQRNDAVLIYELAAKFVCKVLAPVSDTLMDVSDNLATFCSFWRTFIGFRQSALRTRQHFLILAEKARVRDLLASRKCCEAFKANIYANRLIRLWQWFWFNFAREIGVPVTDRIPPNSQGLDLAFRTFSVLILLWTGRCRTILTIPIFESCKPLSRSSNPYCGYVKLS